MSERSFRIVNVFTVDGDRLSGNPLCVFEDGTGLTDEQMQKLARQMNLSETTFVFAGDETCTRRVRIFTPTFEMPFAGHPTLGTAHVVRALAACGDAVKLSMKVGVVDVSARGDAWTLVAAQKPVTRAAASRDDLARMLGLDDVGAIVDEPLWVDTGAEQLVVPLRSVDDVARARPDAALMAQHGYSAKRGASMAYVWAPSADGKVTARFFFLVHGGVVEDPATGSACANLGGWHIATKRALPVHLEVSQGAHVGRPSRLTLHVDKDETISVSGDVIELGRGTISLQ
jgi:trans-2,3-dihydro-3-hydroxyanthranilate isomerase